MFVDFEIMIEWNNFGILFKVVDNVMCKFVFFVALKIFARGVKVVIRFGMFGGIVVLIG